MKLLLIILFTVTLLQSQSQSKETCYTVQLISKYNSKKNIDKLNQLNYPQECKIMQIRTSLTVRCGCFDKIAPAKKNLVEYKKKYKKAVIGTTYKYRFDDLVTKTDTSVEKIILKPLKEIYAESNRTKSNKKIKKSEEKKPKKRKKYKMPKEKISQKDGELRLILQVFLYKGDLKNAYKVATIGYERNKNSYYWNQKMATLSQWTNRSARAMKHLRFMWDYQDEKDIDIENQLIAYGSSSYQYEEIEPLVVHRAKQYPTEKNIDLMIMVYKKIGSPEKVIDVLDKQYQNDPTNEMFVTKALELSLEMGDLELAKKYVNILEPKKPYSKRNASLIARYYYISHNIPLAYDTLLHIDESDTKNEVVTREKHENDIKKDYIAYYEQKSDLGWYLQHNKEATLASKRLMDLNESRLIDYERIAYVYQKSNPKLALKATKKAYEEYKFSYLFYSYANGAINAKNFKELKELLSTIDEDTSPLAKEAVYWLIKSKVYAFYKEIDLAEQALLTAYALEPNNFQIKLELIWVYMETHENTKIKIILTDMAQNSELDSTSYLAMASAYMYLNDINRASYYTQELLELNSPTTKLLEFKFLQAYIYQIQNNEIAFIASMKDILYTLKLQAQKNQKLKTQDIYLSNYLRAAMYVLNPDKFEKKLKKAKKYLKRVNYNEISYSWAMKNNAYEKSLKIYHKIYKKELWLKFSNALVFQNHTVIENMLDIYLNSISMGDAAQASSDDGQKALSQTITFEGLRHNDKNQNAYIQHLSLSQERSDNLNVKIEHYNRKPLLQKYIQIKNKTYLRNAFYLDSGFDYYSNSSLDKKLLLNVPSSTKELRVGISKFFNRGSIGVNAQYHDSIEKYMAYSIFGKYRFSTDIVGEVTLAKNNNAIESIQLLLGGKKDMFSFTFNWSILDSTSLNILYEKNYYNSQDNIYLGKGDYTRINITQQIRNGYPDISIGAFYDFGRYKETDGSRGVIDVLQPIAEPVLPRDFDNMGINIAYGMVNRVGYTRVWRPYIEFFPYYSQELDAYTYGFNLGYGGKILHQDHLSIGASYTDSVSGTGGSIFELYLNYKFLYSHP